MKFLRKDLLLLFLLPALFLIEGAGFLSVILSAAKDLAILVDGGSDIGNGLLQFGFLQLAFLYDDDEPALCLLLPPGVLVSLLITGNF